MRIILEYSVVNIWIIAQSPPVIDCRDTSEQITPAEYDALDARFAKLQKKEAMLRKQRDRDMDTETYWQWQREVDKVNQEIVEILCALSPHNDDEEE